MLRSEVFPYYNKCAEEFKRVYRYLISLYDVDSSVAELAKYRGYPVGSDQYNLLKELKICSCVVPNVEELGTMGKELGLVTSTGRFLLDDRFIIPVHSISGEILSFIGYFPDYKKYITVPSPFFSKDTLFFNIDHAYRLSWEKYDGVVFLVEGIFDCLSLRAIGLPAIATMGSTVTQTKKELLKLFKKVIYIPDNDEVGRRALNRYDKVHGWRVPENAVGVRLKGVVDFNQEGEEFDAEKVIKIKDIDNLVTLFEPDSIREMLLEVTTSIEPVVTFNI